MISSEVVISKIEGIRRINKDEKWKFCPVSNIYLVSNMGRIFSLTHNRIMKPYKDIYYKIKLSSPEFPKGKTYYVHRIVAITWIPNPNFLPEVNHKDEFNKLDNRADNLEWCNAKYNNNYGTKKRRVSVSRQKPVAQFDEMFNLIKVWNGKVDIMNKLGYCDKTIGYHCREKNHFYKGYYWLYAEDKNKGELIKNERTA